MSPKYGALLVQEVAPRLRHIIPNAVKPVGAEDAEELVQDSIVVAAQMLHNLEERGKEVTPGNVCYYVTLHMKSGRRSYSSGRTDAMSPGGQLDGKSSVLSFEEPAGIDPETGDEIPLGDMLAGNADDPSMSASRNVDWDEFLETHDHRYDRIVCDLASGKNAMETARDRRKSYFTVRQLKASLEADLREYMGEQAIADSARIPAWRGNIQADHEKAACRADRRHKGAR
jgi:hypothetical protein